MIGFREKRPKVLTIPLNERYRSHRLALEIIDQYSRENGIPVRQAVLAIVNEYGKMAGMPGYSQREEHERDWERLPEDAMVEAPGIRETESWLPPQESAGEKARHPLTEMEKKQMEPERDTAGKEENLLVAEPVHKEILEDAMVTPSEEKKEPEISNISNQAILDMIRKNYS